MTCEITFDKRLTSLLPVDACEEVKLIALNRKIESALGASPYGVASPLVAAPIWDDLGNT